MPQNFTQKDVVNRGQLLAEYNDPMYTNADGELILPSSLPGSDRKPIGGHCLYFDNSNPDVYIQTTIPSANRYNWRIVIKGEGDGINYRTLYADDSGTNIAIRQMPNAASTDVFYLSYIAFVNITTNKIEHLFECEEGSGTVLYDACTGDTATIENVTSISALRKDSRTKEWIQEEANLDNTYRIHECSGWATGATATNFQDIPFPISLAFRFKAPKGPISEYQGDTIIYWGTNHNTGLTYGIVVSGLKSTNTSLYAYYLNNASTSINNNGVEIKNIRDYLCDNKWHTIIVCVNTTYIKVYIDGELKGTGTHNFSPITTEVPTALNFRMAAVSYTSTIHKDWSINDLLITNWDMSLNDAVYKVSDFEIKKDVPTNTLLGSVENKVWLQWQNNGQFKVYDGSINKKHMTIAYVGNKCMLGTPSKCYGTFYNQVGGTIDNGIIIPRKVIS